MTATLYQFPAQKFPAWAPEASGLPYRYQTTLTHYIEDVVAEFPRIRMSGIYVPATAMDPSYGHGDYPTWHDEYRDLKQRFGDCKSGYLLEVGYCRQFIVECCTPTKTKRTQTTYNWKHVVERWCESLGPHMYINNGAFLAACILEGVKFAVSENSPNAVPFLKLTKAIPGVCV